MTHALPYAANCSLLFTELPLLRRPSAAREAGFDAIEFWWPFDRPVPADADVDAFVRSVDEAGVRLIGLNFFAGDLAGPDCGVASIPGRAAEFRDNIPVAVAIGERLGVTGFNALYGNTDPSSSPAEQDETGTENLAAAARAAAAIGATVLVEAVSGPKPYPLRTAADALRVVDRVKAADGASTGLLLDVYHLAVNGEDPLTVIDDHWAAVAHVQIADAPGRGEPGTGDLAIDRYLTVLAGKGYRGWVSLEYRPAEDTLSGLDWLPRERRSSGRVSEAGR